MQPKTQNQALAAALQGLSGSARQAARQAWYADQHEGRMAVHAEDAKAAQAAMVDHYNEALEQISRERPGLFGKELDRKARRRALRLAGVTLPEGATIAWATPPEWATGGYRRQALDQKVGAA